jgi:hypothetical protein
MAADAIIGATAQAEAEAQSTITALHYSVCSRSWATASLFPGDASTRETDAINLQKICNDTRAGALHSASALVYRVMSSLRSSGQALSGSEGSAASAQNMSGSQHPGLLWRDSRAAAPRGSDGVANLTLSQNDTFGPLINVLQAKVYFKIYPYK